MMRSPSATRLRPPAKAVAVIVALLAIAVVHAGDSVFRSGFEAGEDVTTLSSYKVAGTELAFEAGFLALQMGCNAEAPLTGTLELTRPGQEVDETGYDFVINEEGMLDNVLALHPQCDGTEPGTATYLVDAVNKSDPVDVATAAIDVAVGPQYVLATGPVAATYTCGDEIRIPTNAESLQVVGGPGTAEGNDYTFTPDCTNDPGDRTVGLRGEKSTLVHPEANTHSRQVDDKVLNFEVIPKDIIYGFDITSDGLADIIAYNDLISFPTDCANLGPTMFDVVVNRYVDGQYEPGALTGVQYDPLMSSGGSTTATFTIQPDGSASLDLPDNGNTGTCEDYGATLSSTITLQYDGGEITFAFQTDVTTDEDKWAVTYVDKWLPASNQLHSMHYWEERKIINGSGDMPAYREQIAAILINAFENAGTSVEDMVIYLEKLVDGQPPEFGELYQGPGAAQYDNDALDSSGMRYFLGPEGFNREDHTLTEPDITTLYEIRRQATRDLVKEHPELYAGTVGGIASLDHDPGW